MVDPAAGTDGHFLVYVPADYTPNEKWPVIFYYHGMGGQPDTSLIRNISNGRYCIIVGMSYYSPGMKGYSFLETKDVGILHHVLGILKQRLNVNNRKLYISGFSKGGFYTCEMLRLLSHELAGAIVLGAGSKNHDAKWPDLTGKEVFIGCGQEDNFIGFAKATQSRMEALGATVTFEQWLGVGHCVGDIAGLRKWLFEQTVDRPIDTESEFAEPPTPFPAVLPMAAQGNHEVPDRPWSVWTGISAALVLVMIATAMWLWGRSLKRPSCVPDREKK